MDREPRIVLSGMVGMVLGGVVGIFPTLGQGMGALTVGLMVGGCWVEYWWRAFMLA